MRPAISALPDAERFATLTGSFAFMIQDKKLTHFPFLDGMRGFAALYVVLHHCLAWLAPVLPLWATLLVVPFKFGHTAVSIFIVLSGFSLMLPIAHDPEHRVKGGNGGFLLRRARRIMPPYYAALLLSVSATLLQDWVYGTPPSPFYLPFLTGSVKGDSTIDVLMHLLLLHNLSPRWIGSFNGTLWSIATESQLYFTLPFLLLPLWKRFGARFMVGVAVILGVAVPLALPGLSGACLWYLSLFGFGVACATVVPRLATLTKPETMRLARGLAASLGILLLSYILVSTHQKWLTPPMEPNRVLVWEAALKDLCVGGSVTVLLVYGVLYTQSGRQGRDARSEKKTVPAGVSTLMRVLESRLGAFLCRFSYSLYLTHFVLLDALVRLGVWQRWSAEQIWYWRAFVVMPTCLLFGYIFYLVFERPFLTRGKTSQVSRDMPVNVPPEISR